MIHPPRIVLGLNPCRLAILAIAICLSGCAARPTAAVLEPVAIHQDTGKAVSLLAVTNRNETAGDGGFGSAWSASLAYEHYDFSVPEKRKVAAITYPSRRPDARREFLVTKRERLSESAFVEAASRAASSDGTVALFVHGYNYRYQEALFRAAQMAADAGQLSPPILFSWPSAASVTGYVTDRDVALYSRTGLENVIKILARSPKIKRVVLFGHSMGGFLSIEAVRQLKLEGHDEVLDKLQIVMAAPDIDVDVFRSQLLDIGRLRHPITLLVSKSDGALAASSMLSGERPRVGLVDIDDPRVREAARQANVNVIDVSSVEASDGLGHDRYAALARFGSQLETAEARARTTGNVGAFVFDAAGAAVASPFRLAGQLVRQ